MTCSTEPHACAVHQTDTGYFHSERVNALTEMDNDLFDTFYWPLPAPDGSDIWQHEDVRVAPVEKVWTVVDGDSGGLFAMPGRHIVNRVGYMVTSRAWTHEDITVTLESAEEIAE